MSYLLHSAMSCDPYLVERIAACAASLKVPDPRPWAAAHAIYLVSAPGWDTAYQTWTPPAPTGTTAAADPDLEQGQLPLTAGSDETLITDEMIRTAVQELLNPETAGHEAIIEEP